MERVVNTFAHPTQFERKKPSRKEKSFGEQHVNKNANPGKHFFAPSLIVKGRVCSQKNSAR